jgi:hypothetical protein
MLTPVTAHAASGQRLNMPFVNGRSDLTTTFTAGDCRQTGQNQEPDHQHAYISLQPPTVVGTSTWTWGGTLYTISSRHGDRWHQTWNFKSGGNVVLIISAWGPDGGNYMWPGDFNTPGIPFATTTQSGPINLTSFVYQSITSVDWFGDC